jgi:D-alanyl-D-alanine carboxypeptidase/D-alanyl-D-alanine-endopeptidase (penicillin-binding protein 4)
MITIILLDIFVVAAGVAVVNLTPERDLVLRPATVAERVIVPPGGLTAAADPAAPLPNPAMLAARLAGPMRQAGAPVSAIVIDPMTRRALYDQQSQVGLVPASTTKIVTATAALAALGADHRLTTTVVQNGAGIVLVGGGDPTLSSGSAAAFPRFASLIELAKQTAAALRSRGTTRVRLDYDISLYSGSRTGPGWKPNYVPEGSAAPVTALAVDEGRKTPNVCEENSTAPRAADPPLAATARFAQLLRWYGVVAHVGGVVVAKAGAQRLGVVRSPGAAALVEHMLECSDNDLAEALARQIAIKRHQSADFAGAGQAVHDVLATLGLAQGVQVYDGSGLSVHNRITPAALARIVAFAASNRHPELRPVITGMPVAGFSGTLEDRYATSVTQTGAGVVRAKTGTLSDVTALAGFAYDADGRVLAFAFMVNKVKSVAAARVAVDRLASVVAGCGCRS